MWFLWFIPTLSFGFAVAVLYQKAIKRTPLCLTAQTPEMIPFQRPRTASVTETCVVAVSRSLDVASRGDRAGILEVPARSRENGTDPGLRRTPRMVRSIPLTLSMGSHSLPVRSAVINAHGGLILCSEPIPEGTPVALFNDKTGKRVEASVVWAGVVTLSLASPTLFQFKIGVEFHGLGTGFWGPDYNP
jgi:hypothetical protein